MTLYYADDWLTVYAGDCREVLATLPDESVHCVVTSPPFWGLRDYGTATWNGGDEGCEHVQRTNKHGGTSNRPGLEAQTYEYRDTCGKCGAIRQDSQLGLEATPEQYVENMVAVFREVRRVLRKDGTCWLNLGDSYTSGGRDSFGRGTNKGQPKDAPRAAQPPGLKPKDLVGIPWRVAFALQTDGWYLRSDIIWSKPNPMPESVTDRPTKSHEYLFLLAKSERYYFDADAVREPPSSNSHGALTGDPGAKARHTGNHSGPLGLVAGDGGRNIRSVWTIATQPYPGAHFAVFPPKLVEPCIKAGTSERGVCSECGAPWRRVVEREGGERYATGKSAAKNGAGLATAFSGYTDGSSAPTFTTIGWQPSCAHAGEPVPAVVLDPFAGSGTVGVVAQSLSRRAILIDLNPEYLKQQLRRNAQAPLGLAG